MSALFASVVAASGMSRIFAAASIRRACQKAGADAESLDKDGLAASLPHIDDVLKTYLPAADRVIRMAAIKALIR